MEENNIFKRFIYNSIGFASLATKRMEELVNDLLSQGKVSEEEGRKIMDNFKSATNRSKEDLERDMRSLMEQMMRKMDVAHKRDIEALEARITALEDIHLREGGKMAGSTSGRTGDRTASGKMPPESKPHGDPDIKEGHGSAKPGHERRNDINDPDNPTTI